MPVFEGYDLGGEDASLLAVYLDPEKIEPEKVVPLSFELFYSLSNLVNSRSGDFEVQIGLLQLHSCFSLLCLESSDSDEAFQNPSSFLCTNLREPCDGMLRDEVETGDLDVC